MSSPPSSSKDSLSRAFDSYCLGVRKWIWHQNWTELQAIQERAARPILDCTRDVIIAAPTAGGKTEAAFFPILTRLANDERGSVACLCVSPLKALINDQYNRLESLCEAVNMPIHRWHGDVSQAAKKRLLAQPRGVLLITPESLEANFVLRGTKIRDLFGDLAYVVVDELHAFIGNERGRQLQALLERLERVLQRRVPRVALSATLGDMKLAAEFLRCETSMDPEVIQETGSGTEVKIQVRGYRYEAPRPGMATNVEDRRASGLSADDGGEELVDRHSVAAHLFRVLRGKDNLIFANSRGGVETLADTLRRMSAQERVPNEFLPHHGNLSKEIRLDAEGVLKDSSRPGNVIATTTLELGIDVGSVDSVAQVGIPPSVASLRQRLGRSGRRTGKPAVLRVYVSEIDSPDSSATQDRLRASLVQSVAMIELLLRGWCEPPDADRPHYSTLIQQVLSLISQYGGVRADEAFNALCRSGPFRSVDPPRFASLLSKLGECDLVSQMHDGTLVLGLAGERLVDHFDFYAAFNSPDEYRVVHEGRTLGSLPVMRGLVEDQHIIFAGRRWRVVAVEAEKKTVVVVLSGGGRPPHFDGGGIPVHDRVREEMFEVYRSATMPVYLDAGAQQLLKEGRDQFFSLALHKRRFIEVGNSTHVYPWAGDRVLHTLALLIRGMKLQVANQGISLAVRDVDPDGLRKLLARELDRGLPSWESLTADVRSKAVEKYDHLLPETLLNEEYAARNTDVDGTARFIRHTAVQASAQ